MRNKWKSLHALTCLCVLATVIVGLAPPQAANAAGPSLSWAQMGDSYSSGSDANWGFIPAEFNGTLFAPMGDYGACVVKRWTGSNWADDFLDDNWGSGRDFENLTSLTVYNNKLYMTCETDSGGQYHHGVMVRDTAGNWSVSLPYTQSPEGYYQFGSFGAAVYNSKLYTGVVPYEANTTLTIYQYNGTSWSGIKTYKTGEQLRAWSLGTDGTNLYVGIGRRARVNCTTLGIERFNGSTWTAELASKAIHSMAYYKGSMYAGGNGKIYKRSAGGTWSEVCNTGQAYVIAMTVVDYGGGNVVLYAGTENYPRLYATIDGSYWVMVQQFDTTAAGCYVGQYQNTPAASVTYYESGSPKVVKVWRGSPQDTNLLATYQGSSGFGHLCGAAITGDDWRKTVAGGGNCYMAYGPYVTTLPTGSLKARFWLRVDNNTADNANICTIDVRDATASTTLATATITRQQWTQAGVYQAFDLNFTNPSGNHMIEFRTYYIWYAQLDLDKVEVWLPSGNQAPQVNAGNDQTITLPASANLDGTVTDDGLPNPPGAVTVQWTKQSGPGTVTFGNANAIDTTASFSTSGTYVLRLTASDSALSNYDECTITVNASETVIATYQGSSGFYHQCGAAIANDDWRVTIAVNNCFMAYGPYTTALPGGALKARFWLRVDNNTYDDANICNIDVYDSTAAQYKAGPITISRFDWTQAGVYQKFDLSWTNVAGNQMEFRTFYIWYAQLDIDKVEIIQ